MKKKGFYFSFVLDRLRVSYFERKVAPQMKIYIIFE